jgi:hypothetical protein
MFHICGIIKVVPSSQAGTRRNNRAWWKLKGAGGERYKAEDEARR